MPGGAGLGAGAEDVVFCVSTKLIIAILSLGIVNSPSDVFIETDLSSILTIVPSIFEVSFNITSAAKLIFT